MANSLRNALICAFAATVSSVVGAQSSDTDEILLDSGPFVLDRKTNLIDVQKPHITQGKISITADEATATSIVFDTSSEWRFKGHVRVAVDAGLLTADSAVFTFADKRLARGELGGNATFEDAQTNDKGGAGKLVYDYKARTLQLSDNPWVHKGGNEIHGGCDLLYDLEEKRVTSGSTACAEPNRIRILPRQDGEARAAAPAQ